MRLELRGVDAGYGRAQVLRGVDMVVPTGSVVALLGPNGAGKTTLLRVASGLLRAWSGRVLLGGVEVTAARPARRAAAGLCHVPEGRGVFRSLSVYENLVVQCPNVTPRQAISLATEAFPVLGERLGQVAGTLSGGEQQMLALARTYVSRPSVVLLDEVSMGLAPVVVEQIFSFIRRLAAEGVSVLLVEQYVNKALELSDYAYLLYKGTVVFAGEARELADADVFARYLGTAAALE
jgi:branched-chain amino acid transport system ATP-binding protein